MELKGRSRGSRWARSARRIHSMELKDTNIVIVEPLYDMVSNPFNGIERVVQATSQPPNATNSESIQWN